mmetsp:Transcript_27681/g.90528  ORF Transcript_27681/g.90528 Transcript_27681/m.90528 type:complete len:367 (+) Transcript_27681:33-1133(+)
MRGRALLRLAPCSPRPRCRRNASIQNAAASETSAQTEQGRKPTAPPDLTIPEHYKKRKVALRYGYFGGGFQGNQAGTLPRDATVDGVLERAIRLSGGIRDTNYGKPDKIKWVNSSRTDKGVSSLSTWVSFNILCDPEVHATDPEGRSIAAAISEHLPPTVRAFCVIPVPKSFSARFSCHERMYEYVLPVLALGEGLDEKEEARRLELLRATLREFEGRHPFHCYTKRKSYRTENLRKHNGGRDVNTKRHAPEVPADEAAAAEEAPRRGDEDYYWLLERDSGDPIGTSHFRRVHSFTASEVRDAGEGYGRHIILRVCGESFMFNQIRKMVAVAVAVAPERIAARPRTRVPRAVTPPEGTLQAQKGRA